MYVKSVLKVYNLIIPTAEQIRNCATVEESKEFRSGLDITLNGAAIVMSVPYLQDTVLNANSLDLGELALALLEV